MNNEVDTNIEKKGKKGSKKVIIPIIVSIIAYIPMLIVVAIILSNSLYTTLFYLCYIVMNVLFLLISLFNLINAIKLDNKVLKIVSNCIVAVFMFALIIGLYGGIESYNYSKKSDKVIKEFKKEVDSSVKKYITLNSYHKFKSGDIINSNDLEVPNYKLEKENLYCKWYTKIVDISTVKLETYTICWSRINTYYYKTKGFNGKNTGD